MKYVREERRENKLNCISCKGGRYAWRHKVAAHCSKPREMAESEDVLSSGSSENDSSSRSSSELSPQYSSFPLEEPSSPSESDESQEESTVQPYMYEPETSCDEEAEHSSDDESENDRLDNTDW